MNEKDLLPNSRLIITSDTLWLEGFRSLLKGCEGRGDDNKLYSVIVNLVNLKCLMILISVLQTGPDLPSRATALAINFHKVKMLPFSGKLKDFQNLNLISLSVPWLPNLLELGPISAHQPASLISSFKAKRRELVKHYFLY